MKLTKNQTMQQRKTPAAADGIIKNHARNHPAPEPCESIIQPISTNNTGEENKLPGSLQKKIVRAVYRGKNLHDKTEKRNANRKIQRRIELEQLIRGQIRLGFDEVQRVRC